MTAKYGGNGRFLVFATKQIDAFKTRQKRKVVGVMNIMGRADTGEYAKDFEGAEDLSTRKEDEAAVLNIVRKIINNGSDTGILLPAGESRSMDSSKSVAPLSRTQRAVTFVQGQSFRKNYLALRRSLATHHSSTCLQER
jgi:hypothetical protein